MVLIFCVDLCNKHAFQCGEKKTQKERAQVSWQAMGWMIGWKVNGVETVHGKKSFHELMNGHLAKLTTPPTYPLAPSEGLNGEVAHWQGGSHRQLLLLEADPILLQQWQPGIPNWCLKGGMCIPFLAEITGHMVEGEEQMVLWEQAQGKTQLDLLVPSGRDIVMQNWTGYLGDEQILARTSIDALK